MRNLSQPSETVIGEIREIWREMSLRLKLCTFVASGTASSAFVVWLDCGC